MQYSSNKLSAALKFVRAISKTSFFVLKQAARGVSLRVPNKFGLFIKPTLSISTRFALANGHCMGSVVVDLIG